MSIVSIIIVALVLLAWLVPLIVGIKMMRGPKRSGGIVLLVIGILWGLPSILGMVLAGMFWSGARSSFELKDFNPAKFTGAMGVIQTSAPGPCRVVLKPQAQKVSGRYTSTDGSFKVPVGSYRVEQFALQATDEKGKQWEAITAYPLKTSLSVTEQTPVALKVGPPYRAKIKVEHYATMERLSLEYTDASGADVSFKQGGTTPPAPSFQILDKSGKVCHSGRFAYG